ncbi:MAG TPA: GIY-YIG nuclease family protein [Candidatus Acidoferrum sp.]|nr:GIY-YIG nuclease family protein [Candidatus Acidoferrum sp.]
MKFYVYILINPAGNTYVGQTSDLERRLAQHNDPVCRLTLHTKRRAGLWRLLHFEEFPSRSAAMRREKELKSGKGREWIRRELIPRC